MSKSKKEETNEALMNDLFKNDDLSMQEREFILNYLETMNISQSYLKAFPNAKKNTAAIMGNILLKRDYIKSAVKRLKKIIQRSYDIDPTKYIEFQLKGANADII